MSIDELVQHMSAALFVPALQAENKDDALEKLTDAVIAGSAINDRHTILEMLRNREQLGSTALEKGVAFPHGRSLAVKKLTILIARSHPRELRADLRQRRPPGGIQSRRLFANPS